MVGGRPPPTASGPLWVLLCIGATLLKGHSYFLAGVDVSDLVAGTWDGRGWDRYLETEKQHKENCLSFFRMGGAAWALPTSKMPADHLLMFPSREVAASPFESFRLSQESLGERAAYQQKEDPANESLAELVPHADVCLSIVTSETEIGGKTGFFGNCGTGEAEKGSNHCGYRESFSTASCLACITRDSGLRDRDAFLLGGKVELGSF